MNGFDQVSRVTDLVELLESVETAKADEYIKNFQDGDVIEFTDVTIVTPAYAFLYVSATDN